ncbi:arginine kinase 1 isoform X1 [Anopheles ziemanni]|uniref:arginine kinase 1 isoform X1 n=2 Tax=Anopheles coustani TaxID=139045 RepID=UPI00265826A6|nr:arginine kinase 1 isoform X1 [Anopheles coustani]XP_058171510.1 arginine kinase 1 isoform X1 [Anopheles ziemanni]
MFALWYFSLAMDELRKRFPFLDRIFAFFTGNKRSIQATGPESTHEDIPETLKELKESELPSEKATLLKPTPVEPPKPVELPKPKPAPVVEPAKPLAPKVDPPKTPTTVSPAVPEKTVPPTPAVATDKPASEPAPPVKPTPVEPAKPAPKLTPPVEAPKPEPAQTPAPPAQAPVKEPAPVPAPAPVPTPSPTPPRLVKEKKELPAPTPKSAPVPTPTPAPPPSEPAPKPEPTTVLPSNNEDSFIIVEQQKPAPAKPAPTKPKVDLKNSTMDFLQGEGGGRNVPAPSSANRNKSDTMVDAAVLEKMEAGFAKLAASDSKSLLKKYLTREVFDALKNKKTSFGSTLLDCVQSGFENPDSGVGIYAPDAEAYTLFADLFDPIIEDYHKGFKKTDKHPARDFGDVAAFGNVDPTGEFVVSTRVRCGRSMEGYPFNPCLTEAQYKEMEDKVSATLSGLDGELKGKFYPLTGMDKAVQQQLIDDHFLFKEGDRFLQAANACRFWPTGRGIYHNDNKTFLVWCNEEDHLRIISMQMGGDLGQIYRRLVTAVNDIEKRIPFSHHDRLGFLTFCPTNLGTTIRASVHIKVPKLAKDYAKLEATADKYNLQVRGTRGEHSEAEGGIYDISNKRRMGLTEFQAVKEMYDGISEIIKIEKSL